MSTTANERDAANLERAARTMLISEQTLAPQERRAVLVGMLTDVGVLAAGRRALRPGAYQRGPEGVILQALYSYYDEYQACPGYQAILAATDAVIERSRSPVSALPPQATAEEIQEVVNLAYFSDRGERDTAHCLALLRRFVEEDGISRIESQRRTSPMIGGLRYQPEQLLERYREVVAAANSVTSSPPHGLIPTGRIDRHADPNLPTGIPFIDRTLEDGACQAGKTYGLLGPFGSYKTTLGVQILTSTAAGLARREEPGVRAYFAYGDYASAAYKALTQVTGIAKRSLKDLDAAGYDLDVLSTSNTLLGYESAHYDRERTPAQERLGERERWERAVALRDRFAFYDKDNPENQTAGSRGVVEVEADLDELVRRTG